MPLDPRPAYPHALCYVLKLHRDSRPADGSLRGVLEHVTSGDVIPFRSAPALQDALAAHAAGVRTGAPRDTPPEE